MKSYLNLGCGKRFHPAWTNIDYYSSHSSVLSYNLNQGIPFADGSFEVVYHSHLLEHFSKKDAIQFLLECYRVLKPNGLIRIAVPDLEIIVKEYLKNLENALKGDKEAQHHYDWIMLELYDQAVRTKSGGNMATYLFQDEIPNQEYVFARLGEEARNLRRNHLELRNQAHLQSHEKDNRSAIRKLLSKTKRMLKGALINNYKEKENEMCLELGKFRTSGEVHQWMYDRYSLTRLLKETGFKEAHIQSAFISLIPNWNSFELESKNGIIYKPDSLFMEARK